MKALLCFAFALLAGCACSKPAPGKESGPSLTVEEVKQLSKNGVPDNTIINRIRDTHSVFHLTREQTIDLANAGVSQRVIDYMVETGQGSH